MSSSSNESSNYYPPHEPYNNIPFAEHYSSVTPVHETLHVDPALLSDQQTRKSYSSSPHVEHYNPQLAPEKMRNTAPPESMTSQTEVPSASLITTTVAQHPHLSESETFAPVAAKHPKDYQFEYAHEEKGKTQKKTHIPLASSSSQKYATEAQEEPRFTQVSINVHKTKGVEERENREKEQHAAEEEHATEEHAAEEAPKRKSVTLRKGAKSFLKGSARFISHLTKTTKEEKAAAKERARKKNAPVEHTMVSFMRALHKTASKTGHRIAKQTRNMEFLVERDSEKRVRFITRMKKEEVRPSEEGKEAPAPTSIEDMAQSVHEVTDLIAGKASTWRDSFVEKEKKLEEKEQHALETGDDVIHQVKHKTAEKLGLVKHHEKKKKLEGAPAHERLEAKEQEVST